MAGEFNAGAIVADLKLHDEGFHKSFEAAIGVTEGLEKAMTSLKGAMVSGVGLEFAEMVNKSAELTDQLGKQAQQIGMTTEQLSSYSVVAALSDISTESLGHSIQLLSKNMVDAADGGEAMAGAFSSIGLSVTDAQGRLKSSDEMLSELADKFQTMPDGAEKTSIALQLMGRSGAQMIPLLNGGADAIENIKKEAQKMGLVFSHEAFEAAEKFNDSQTRVKQSLIGMRQQFTSTIIELVNQTGVFDKVSAAIQSVTGFWMGLSTETKTFIVTAAGVTAAILAIAGAALALPPIIAAVGGALEAAFITNPIGLVLTGIALAIGFVVANMDDFKRVSEVMAPTIDALGKSFDTISDALYDIFKTQDEHGGKIIDDKKMSVSFEIVKSLSIIFINLATNISDTVTKFQQLAAVIDFISVTDEMRGKGLQGVQAGWKTMTETLKSLEDAADERDRSANQQIETIRAMTAAVDDNTESLHKNDEAAERNSHRTPQGKGGKEETVDLFFLDEMDKYMQHRVEGAQRWADDQKKISDDIKDAEAARISQLEDEREQILLNQKQEKEMLAMYEKVEEEITKPLLVQLTFNIHDFLDQFTKVSPTIEGLAVRWAYSFSSTFQKVKQDAIDAAKEAEASKVVEGEDVSTTNARVNAAGEKAGAAFSDGFNTSATSSISKTISAISSAVMQSLQATANLLAVQQANLVTHTDFAEKGMEHLLDSQLAAMTRELDAEIAALTAQKDQMIQAEQNYQDRLREMRDAFSAEEEAKMNEALRGEFDRLQAQYDAQIAAYQNAGLSQIELDAKKQDALAELEAKKNQLIAQGKKGLADKVAENNDKMDKESKASADAEKKREQALADQIKAVEKQKQDAKEQTENKKKELEKGAKIFEWLSGRAAFEASKKAQVAQAEINMAMGIQNAINAGIMASSIPIVGIVLGPALGIALTAMAVRAGTTAIQAAHSQQYPPPPVFAEGGMASGPSIFGESGRFGSIGGEYGTELAIPANNPGKDFGALKAEVARELVGGGGGRDINLSITNNFSPRDDYEMIKARLNEDFRDMVRSAVA